MKVNWKVLTTVIVASAVGFVLEAPGPVGKRIWPLPSTLPEPEGANQVLLAVMGAVEAVAFGVGVAFLIFGYASIRRLAAGPAWYTTAVFLAAAWTLVNWVPHTSLHMNHGNILTAADFTGLVRIEYGFHLTLIIAGAFLASFVLRMARGRGISAGTSTAATSKGRPAAA